MSVALSTICCAFQILVALPSDPTTDPGPRWGPCMPQTPSISQPMRPGDATVNNF